MWDEKKSEVSLESSESQLSSLQEEFYTAKNTLFTTEGFDSNVFDEFDSKDKNLPWSVVAKQTPFMNDYE